MSLKANGWTLLFHDMMIGQVSDLADCYGRAKKADPQGFAANANVRLFGAVAKLVLRTVPDDPGRLDHRIGNTMGEDYRHWSRAKFGGRFRLFFRYDSAAKIIIFAWVNNEDTLRNKGGRNDPYTVFKGMLDRDNPPDDWGALLKAAKDMPDALLKAIAEASKS